MSLIPNAGLLGVLFTYWRRKRATSLRGAVIWLVLAGGSGLLMQGSSAGSDLIWTIAFAFLVPPCVYSWIRFQQESAPESTTAKILLLAFLTCLVALWVAYMVSLSFAIIKNAWNPF